jgi:CRP-like cAMP-binding protein
MNLKFQSSQLHQPKLNHLFFRSHPEVWQTLAPSVHSKIYHKDESVVHHGDAASGLWLVYRGWVKLTRQTPDGKETIISLCTEGDVFGEAALFPHANYPYNAEVVGMDAELASIPAEMIRTLIAKDASLSSHIMSLLNERTSQAQLKLEHMSTMSAAQRLGCFLLRLCHTQVDGGKTLQIPVDKNILAAYLGMKPETLSRSQQQLKTLGIAVNGHTITINNISHLREFVCGSCSESGSGSCDVED